METRWTRRNEVFSHLRFLQPAGLIEVRSATVPTDPKNILIRARVERELRRDRQHISTYWNEWLNVQVPKSVP
jgi:hypothetical protein